jgi:hypothetical protein
MNRGLPEQHRVVLYKRSSPGHVAVARQRALETRLERLDDDGTVETLDVRSWPKVLPVSGKDHQQVRETLDALLAWADGSDAMLKPFFEQRPATYNEMLGISLEAAYILPVTALLVYDEADELVAAYPHTSDDGPESVPDAIRSLAAQTDGPEVAAENDSAFGSAD